MDSVNFINFCLSIVWLYYVITVTEADLLTITNEVEVEKKFLRHRVKLAHKLQPVGGRISKNYVNVDPVCGMRAENIETLCVNVIEKLYDRTLAKGLHGTYKKSVMKPLPDGCIDAKVLLHHTQRKKSIRIKAFRCPLSNYIFEKGFQIKDFYLTSSSSLRAVYMLRDLNDTSPLHIGRLEDYEENVFYGDPEAMENYKYMMEKIKMEFPSQMDKKDESSSSDSEADVSKIMNNISSYGCNDTSQMTFKDGQYFARDGSVFLQLYAYMTGLKLKRFHMNFKYQKLRSLKKRKKISKMWNKIWTRSTSPCKPKVIE